MYSPLAASTVCQERKRRISDKLGGKEIERDEERESKVREDVQPKLNLSLYFSNKFPTTTEPSSPAFSTIVLIGLDNADLIIAIPNC